MTPRERWNILLSGGIPDRIPTDYSATPEVTNRLKHDLGCVTVEDLCKKLYIDKRIEVKPKPECEHHPNDPEADIWGIRYVDFDYGLGCYRTPVHHPLAEIRSVEEVHDFKWPDPEDFDYDDILEQIESTEGYWPIHCGVYEPFLLYGYLRGLEQAFTDLIMAQDIADAILDHIFEFHYKMNRLCFEAGSGRILTTFIAEDLGSQSGPLISLETYRRFLLPNQIKMADLAREYDIHIMYHTDGAARIFLPDLIDKVGIEILNPIQWRCPGMEREGLVRDYGDRVIFHGSIDNQKTLARGSVKDVIREVTESIEIYRPAHWICAPCHNIQPVTPTDNIVAMYETIHRLGEY